VLGFIQMFKIFSDAGLYPIVWFSLVLLFGFVDPVNEKNVPGNF
jgi:hypothetical protein